MKRGHSDSQFVGPGRTSSSVDVDGHFDPAAIDPDVPAGVSVDVMMPSVAMAVSRVKAQATAE